MMSPLVEYTKLLHKAGRLDAPEVTAFRKQYEGDVEFVNQAHVVETAYKARWAYKDSKRHEEAVVR